MSTQSAKSSRNRRLWKLIIFCILAVPILAWFLSTRAEWQRRKLASAKMQLAILRLSLKCPDGLSEAQWAYCVAWTMNLHGNYGSWPVPGHVPTEDLNRIADELNRRIDLGADLGTIDWVWDQYFLAYPRAAHYNNYRPTGEENRAEFEGLKHNEFTSTPLAELQQDYQRGLAEFEQKH